MADKMTEHQAWPARAAGLALLGAAIGVAIERLVSGVPNMDAEAGRPALALFLAVFGFAFGFTLERVRPLWSLVFAVTAAAIVALVYYWNGSPAGWSAGGEWRLIASLLVVAVAAPLFQASRDAGRFALAPEPVHAHAWTNLVLWFSVWAFTGIAFLLVQLLAELFLLIGIDWLRTLLRKGWVNAAIIGGALGGAIGLLRDRDRVLGLFQRVVTTVLSVLAPVLAAGLVLFVAALPFTGLTPLWDTTRATTPTLLAVIAGAFILANAVLGNSAEEEAGSRLLRWSALALALVIAPLALVAAVSTWLRVDQYGFTPERLWALVFVGLVLVVAVTYALAVLAGRRAWSARIRPANVRLALGLCGTGLLLATPLIDFGAIATRDQLARLQAGHVPPEQFDWAALRFDFGAAGRRALADLSQSGPATVRDYARQALRETNRWELAQAGTVRRRDSQLRASLRTLPRPVPVPDDLRQVVAQSHICGVGECLLFWQPGEARAVAVGFTCETCQAHVSYLQFRNGSWQPSGPLSDTFVPRVDHPALPAAQRQAVAAGRVEIRPVPRRQVFIDSRPVGGAFP